MNRSINLITIVVLVALLGWIMALLFDAPWAAALQEADRRADSLAATCQCPYCRCADRDTTSFFTE